MILCNMKLCHEKYSSCTFWKLHYNTLSSLYIHDKYLKHINRVRYDLSFLFFWNILCLMLFVTFVERDCNHYRWFQIIWSIFRQCRWLMIMKCNHSLGTFCTVHIELDPVIQDITCRWSYELREFKRSSFQTNVCMWYIIFSLWSRTRGNFHRWVSDLENLKTMEEQTCHLLWFSIVDVRDVIHDRSSICHDRM